MHEEFTIICLSREELSGTVYYNSALVPLSLAEITNVIFFEPPWDCLAAIAKNPLKYFSEFRRKKAIINQRKFPAKLKAVKLFCIFPWGWRNRWIKKLNETFLLLQIRWNIRFYAASKRILLTYWRESEKLAKKIAVSRRIYHCTDEIAGFPWPDEDAKHYAIIEEAKVAKMADVVLVTSPALVERMSVYNSNVKILANDAVDFELFNKALTMPFPDEFSGLRRPVVGYVGVLAEYKQDFNLIRKIASDIPEWTFVLVGPVKKNTEVPRLKNLVYLGPRIREEAPRYIAAFDVCIIPHNINLVMSHSFAMKFFEYLALGKPVVSTDIPSLRLYNKYVYLAQNAEEFEKYLKIALEEDSTRKQKERIHFASLHSWANRGPKIMQLFLE